MHLYCQFHLDRVDLETARDQPDYIVVTALEGQIHFVHDVVCASRPHPGPADPSLDLARHLATDLMCALNLALQSYRRALRVASQRKQGVPDPDVEIPF